MFLYYKIKIFLLTFLLIFIPLSGNAKKAPESFANLAEVLSPSVVNISTTTIIEDRKNNLPPFPPGSPFEEFFKQFQDPNQGKRKAQSLGSGFIIDKKGYIITNNHVIENAEKN
jgi:serine protease Do